MENGEETSEERELRLALSVPFALDAWSTRWVPESTMTPAAPTSNNPGAGLASSLSFAAARRGLPGGPRPAARTTSRLAVWTRRGASPLSGRGDGDRQHQEVTAKAL